jgi:CRISPR-associated protein Cmr2
MIDENREAVLIFTFSPVQAFISEARRTEDLANSSAILVTLARAVVKILHRTGNCRLVYPDTASIPNLEQVDAPNVLVAVIPAAQISALGTQLQDGFFACWQKIAADARQNAQGFGLPIDAQWEQIWQRQLADVWQIFWATAEITRDYATAYREARKALDAAKHTRLFATSGESGLKDSLSGKRTALHTAQLEARIYWEQAAQALKLPNKLQPNGKERLDARAVVKRFADLGTRKVYSTTRLAADSFMQAIRLLPQQERLALVDFEMRLKMVLRERLTTVNQDDPDWKYDGDYFYPEFYTTGRFPQDVDEKTLDDLCKALQKLTKSVGQSALPYFAGLLLDGDSIGKRIDTLLNQQDAESAHRAFSQQLSQFASDVPTHFTNGSLVYNGGDDVLALTGLTQAIKLGDILANAFAEKVQGCTASAGIVFAHHLLPLEDSLAALRDAEKRAKNRIKGKNALCVALHKRGGAPIYAASKWSAVKAHFDPLVLAFKNRVLSASLPYHLRREAETVQYLGLDAQRSWLEWQARQHSSQMVDVTPFVDHLYAWLSDLNDSFETGDGDKHKAGGLVELTNWLLIARFLANGGEE